MKEYAAIWIVAGIDIALVVSLAVGMALQTRDREHCYRNGYPTLVSGYCVRIEHGTEVMVPIESLR